MIRKYISLLIIVLTCLIPLSVSMAVGTESYTTSIYLGDKLNLRNYISESKIDFNLNQETVVQNLNASILSVNSSYVITAKDVGRSVLMISNGDQSFNLNIEVESPIKDVRLEESRISLLLGEIYEINYTVEHKLANKEVDKTAIKWTSSKPRVATIVDGNKIYTQAAGKTTFTGKTVNGDVLLKLDLTVLGHDHKVLVSSAERIRSLNVGESVALQAKFGTKDITETIEWVSLTPHVVKVDKKGTVTAIGEGRGEVEARTSAKNNKTTYKLDAYSMIDKVSLNHSLVKFKAIGQREQLLFNLYPKNKNNPPILTGYKYVSSNESVVSVSSTGLMKAEGPGIALVSVIFDDSQKRASCTVEVPNNDEVFTGNYIEVESAELYPHDGIALIGQKIALDYKILPENASDKGITFTVPHGDDKQIQLIDGIYYFIPEKRGSVQIELQAADGKKDLVSIPVTSPIDELDLSLSTRRIIGTNEEKLYIGEEAELLTRVYTKKGYDKSDVYPTSLVYEVKNKAIASIITVGNKHYVKGLKRGKTEIKVSNLEGMHEASLWIEVENPIASISSDSYVVLPLGVTYQPRINSVYLSSVRDLDEHYSVASLLDLSTEAVYISEGFVLDEIAYEEGAILKYGNPPYEPSVHDKVLSHQSRLDQLYRYKSHVVDGYAEIKLYDDFRDRNGRLYKFVEISGNRLVSNYPIKADMSMQVPDTPYKATTTIQWGGLDDGFRIKRGASTYRLATLIEQYGLSSTLGNLTVEEQEKLLVTYINNTDLFVKTPSYRTLSAVSAIEGDNQLISLVKRLDKNVTKSDLARVSVALHKKYINRFVTLDKTVESHYYDVLDQDLKQAIALDYIQPINSSVFGSEAWVTQQDYNEMVRQIISSDGSLKNGSSQYILFEDLVLSLGQLIQ